MQTYEIPLDVNGEGQIIVNGDFIKIESITGTAFIKTTGARNEELPENQIGENENEPLLALAGRSASIRGGFQKLEVTQGTANTSIMISAGYGWILDPAPTGGIVPPSPFLAQAIPETEILTNAFLTPLVDYKYAILNFTGFAMGDKIVLQVLDQTGRAQGDGNAPGVGGVPISFFNPDGSPAGFQRQNFTMPDPAVVDILTLVVPMMGGQSLEVFNASGTGSGHFSGQFTNNWN